MFDTHYDLLSIAYVCYLKNDYSYIEMVSKYFNKDNVTGVFANLYFMDKDEMVKELHEDYYKENVSVLDMFIKAKEVLDEYLPDTKIIYSIEGADYIKDCDELVSLYENGLDALIIAWNTQNKYASGNRSDQGLTIEGKELIKKAIDLGMGIDLSHANRNTFNDLIDVIKSSDKDVICYASHSNSRVLCDRDRNLVDEQILQIKDVNGMIGVFSNKNFVVLPHTDRKATSNDYLNHIKHVTNLIGTDNVMTATDDMDFCKDTDPEYSDLQLYDYGILKSCVYNTLKESFSEEEIYNMMYNNVKSKIYDKIKSKRREK